MPSDLTDAPEVVRDHLVIPSKPAGWPWPPPPMVSSAQALAVATADAEREYGGNLGRFRIDIRLEDDGWHIAHLIHQRHGSRIAGGGPHYVVSADTGEIVSKKYYQ